MPDDVVHDQQQREQQQQSPATAIKAYSPIEAGLAELRQQYENIVFPVATTKGMDAAVQARKHLRETRLALEDARKLEKAESLRYGKLVDSEAEKIELVIRSLEDPIIEQIRAHEALLEKRRQEKEARERARVSSIHARIAEIRDLALAALKLTSAEVATALAEAEAVVIEETVFQEFMPDALKAREETIAKLKRAKGELEELETERARVKAEREAFEKEQAEQRARDKAQRANDGAFEELEGWITIAGTGLYTVGEWMRVLARCEGRRGNDAVLPDRRDEYEAERQKAWKALEGARAAQQRSDELRVERQEAERLEREAEDKRRAEARDAEDKRLASERAEIERQQRELREQQDRAAEQERQREADRKRDDEARAAEQREKEAAAERERLAQARRERINAAKLTTLSAAFVRVSNIATDTTLDDATARDEIRVLCEANGALALGGRPKRAKRANPAAEASK